MIKENEGGRKRKREGGRGRAQKEGMKKEKETNGREGLGYWQERGKTEEDVK